MCARYGGLLRRAIEELRCGPLGQTRRVLTVLLVALAIATGVLLLVRTNRHATVAENRITVVVAVAFIALLALDPVW